MQPLIPLDSPELKHGPYTQEQFEAGHIGISDLGKLYGYCYQPMRFTGDPDAIMGTTVYEVLGSDEFGRPTIGKRMPLCSSREEAVKVLQDHGYYGHVQRYAHDDK